MALSDCEKCWDTPCECGFRFRDWSKERLAEFIASTMLYKTTEESKLILDMARIKQILQDKKIDEK